MSKLFQISEEDLRTLEQSLPVLSEVIVTAGRSALNNRVRGHLRRVKQILSDVRWHDGPPTEVEELHDHEDVKRELG